MSDPIDNPPTLSSQSPPPRIRFLTKLNPSATPASAARKAAIYGGVAATVCFLTVGVRHWQTAQLPWGSFILAAGIGAIVGAAIEWQGFLNDNENENE